jgi:hypothetical protein
MTAPTSEYGDLRVASYDQLKHICDEAKKQNYNAQLQDTHIAMLDPEGENLLVPALVHEHAQGKLVEPHMRAFAYMKATDQLDPMRHIIDIPMKQWESLTSVDNVEFGGDPR